MQHSVLRFGLTLLCALSALNACGPTLSTPPPPSSPDESTPPVARPSTFSFVSRTTATCPRGALWCNANWPDTSNGTVYLYTLKETRTATSAEITRTAYVYKPTRLTTSAPVLLFLHGGTSSGETGFENTPLASMADSRGDSPGVSWRKNTSTCRFKADASGYERPNGDPCIAVYPPEVTFTNSQPFFLVFPNGVFDPGSSTNRHWEDGRNPSPGFDVVAENRDDVGFIDALIAAIKNQEDPLVDSQRIYITGVSNGGMMTMRLACNTNQTALPELSRVAAFAAFVASMPAPLYDGSNNRERCDSPGAVPLALFVGRAVDTPNCTTYGCSSPVVSGDGRMPYGTAGGRYTINSPDLGTVVAFADTESRWVANLTQAAGTPTLTTTALGEFTTHRERSFASSTIRLRIFDTDSGLHAAMGTRMDFNPNGRLWEFVSSFRKLSNGTITDTTPAHLSGTY